VDISKWNASQRARVLKEINFLRTLKHENLIKFFGAWMKDKGTVVFVTELMGSGTLKQ
jgi:WNK lysine deficient protein kinase